MAGNENRCESRQDHFYRHTARLNGEGILQCWVNQGRADYLLDKHFKDIERLRYEGRPAMRLFLFLAQDANQPG